MAAGDLVVADYQVELRATLMGETTAYELDYNAGAISGLFDVNVKTAGMSYAHADGEFLGESFAAARTVTVALVIAAATPTAAGDALEVMETTWAPATTEQQLYFRVPGFGKRYVTGWPLGIAVDAVNLPFGVARVLATFRATDPTIKT